MPYNRPDQYGARNRDLYWLVRPRSFSLRVTGSNMEKKTNVFDELDNVLGNYAEGKATAEDVAMVAEKVNRYCLERPHPDDVFQNVA